MSWTGLVTLHIQRWTISDYRYRILNCQHLSTICYKFDFLNVIDIYIEKIFVKKRVIEKSSILCSTITKRVASCAVLSLRGVAYAVLSSIELYPVKYYRSKSSILCSLSPKEVYPVHYYHQQSCILCSLSLKEPYPVQYYHQEVYHMLCYHQ
jgi:hypothetical protein